MNYYRTYKALALFFISGIIFSAHIFGMDEEFARKLNTLRWVAYAPTNFDPGANQYPDRASIEKDLKRLLKAGFSGVITYGANNTLADIPRIAKKAGFQAVIMGIWSILDKQEMAGAVNAARYVDGYCAGNEGLLYKRYTINELNAAIGYLKERTGKPVATSEQIGDYQERLILEAGDWVFPNVHPGLRSIKSPKESADWVKARYASLKSAATLLNKPVLLKEAGYPTAGGELASEDNQRVFFKLLELTGVRFAYFEAFDQAWKRLFPIEPHWGLFDKTRRPKRFIAEKINK